MAILRIGVPRRHDLLCYDHLDCGRPGLGLLIGEHGEGCRLSRPMAGLAVLLQNRRYILGKRRRSIARLLPERGCRAAQRDRKQNKEKFHGFSNLTIWTCQTRTVQNSKIGARVPDYFHLSSPSTMLM